jgi:hypothetical protein
MEQYGRTDVERIYIMWGVLLLLFALVFIIMSVKEGKIVRPDEAAMDPMFRRNRPAKGDRRTLGRGSAPPPQA